MSARPRCRWPSCDEHAADRVTATGRGPATLCPRHSVATQWALALVDVGFTTEAVPSKGIRTRRSLKPRTDERTPR